MLQERMAVAARLKGTETVQMRKYKGRDKMIQTAPLVGQEWEPTPQTPIPPALLIRSRLVPEIDLTLYLCCYGQAARVTSF